MCCFRRLNQASLEPNTHEVCVDRCLSLWRSTSGPGWRNHFLSLLQAAWSFQQHKRPTVTLRTHYAVPLFDISSTSFNDLFCFSVCLCACVLCTCTYMWTWAPLGIRYTGARSTNSCEPLGCGCCGWSVSPLQEQQVLLTALEPFSFCLSLCFPTSPKRRRSPVSLSL